MVRVEKLPNETGALLCAEDIIPSDTPVAGKGHKSLVNSIGPKNGNLKTLGVCPELIQRPGRIRLIKKGWDRAYSKEIGTRPINIKSQVGEFLETAVKIVRHRGGHPIAHRKKKCPSPPPFPISQESLAISVIVDPFMSRVPIHEPQVFSRKGHKIGSDPLAYDRNCLGIGTISGKDRRERLEKLGNLAKGRARSRLFPLLQEKRRRGSRTIGWRGGGSGIGGIVRRRKVWGHSSGSGPRGGRP